MSTETKHTPGPWQFIPNRVIAHVDGQAVEVCAIKEFDLLDTPERERIDANGALIAAAPDLLAACKMALGYMESELENENQHCFKWRSDPLERCDCEICQHRAAISKAEGKA